ncbi:MAG: lactonase family protein [Chitinophagaceae bacterium]|nr:lactonase family protein [Chitinophagaceae bacterium]
MKYILFAFSCLIFINTTAQTSYMLAGTYDSPLNQGIHVYSYDGKTGKVTERSHFKISNPSYLTVSPDKKFVFAVEEDAATNGRSGNICSFSFDVSKGDLTFIDRKPTGGDHPCHVECDKTGRWLFVSNYTSGSLSVVPVKENGKLGEPVLISHYGKGADTVRQRSPHVHGAFISSDNKKLFVTDLGLDRIYVYPFDASSGKLGLPDSIQALPGSGPRSLAFNQDNSIAYVIEELNGTVEALSLNQNGIRSIQTISTHKTGDALRPGSADIKIRGFRLYASNRGDINDIAIYKIDPFTGQLKLIGYQSVLGDAPRNFSIDPSGKYLFCANQNSNEIVVFRIRKNGTLKDSGRRVKLGKPVCIKWIS